LPRLWGNGIDLGTALAMFADKQPGQDAHLGAMLVNKADTIFIFRQTHMKNITTFLLILFATWASAQADITPQVTEALKKGDAAALATHFMPQVEVTLNGEDTNYTKAEAQKTLTAFFTQHPITGFVIKHQGTSKLDDQYRIGELITSKGNFRVTFFMKKSGAVMQIKQLKIESAEE